MRSVKNSKKCGTKKRERERERANQKRNQKASGCDKSLLHLGKHSPC